MKQFTYVIPPEGCETYLTPWKRYDVVNTVSYLEKLDAHEFSIQSDSIIIHALSKECPHLNGRDWIIPEIGQVPDGWTEQKELAPLVGTGKEFDTGKPRYDLIPPECLEAMTKILTFGAEKYGDNTWQKLSNAKNRYYAALQRHQQAKRQGEFSDTESGLPHSAHVAVNAMFLLYLDSGQKPKREKRREGTGKKFDNGKLRYDLLPPYCLLEAARAFSGASGGSYYEEMENHLQLWRMGEKGDHLTKAFVNALHLLCNDLKK